jgi:hypothetical protein
MAHDVVKSQILRRSATGRARGATVAIGGAIAFVLCALARHAADPSIRLDFKQRSPAAGADPARLLRSATRRERRVVRLDDRCEWSWRRGRIAAPRGCRERFSGRLWGGTVWRAVWDDLRKLLVCAA